MRPELLDPEFLIAYLRDHTKFDANLVENIINEWKAYKATGLEPEGIKLMKEREEWQPMAKITQMCGVSLDRLRELAEADKDGRCRIDPCKQFETVYYILDKRMYVGWYLTKVAEHTHLVLQDRIEMGICWVTDGFWFLSSETAEAALEAGDTP